MPPHVLFVCLGNICRSPTAEVVFREAARRVGLRTVVASAGTGQWHVGKPPDRRAIQHALLRGYDLSPLRARLFERADFDRFDWILAMDSSVLRDVRALAPAGFSGELRAFMDFVPGAESKDVPDPYSGGPAGFERVLDLVIEGSERLATVLATRDAAPHRGGSNGATDAK